MNVVVLFNEPAADASVDDQDILIQRNAVTAALRKLGHEVHEISCTLNLQELSDELERRSPEVVFNLVESLGGSDHLMTLATMLLDHLQLPYTGSDTAAILATSNKIVAKRRLVGAGLPTPAWFCEGDSTDVDLAAMSRWILKPVLEHASVGMDDEAIVEVNSTRQLEAKLVDRQRQLGKPLFAEQFVDGREFNLSALAGNILPAAEIDFSAFPDNKPRIVGHLAKWDVDSFEYQQTPRKFTFAAHDQELLNRLKHLSTQCWDLFGVSGYARVDFRVDEHDQPWILEVNVNPCLSPDAGFAAALSEASISFESAIQTMLSDAMHPLKPRSYESSITLI